MLDDYDALYSWDLFGLDCNVYVFKLCLRIVEIVLDVARNVAGPIARL